MHTTPLAHGILVLPMYFIKFMLFESWFKDIAGTTDHVHRDRLTRRHAEVNQSPTALSRCVSLASRKSNFVRFQSNYHVKMYFKSPF